MANEDITDEFIDLMVPFCRYLISRLDEHGDGFREAQVPVMWEVSFTSEMETESVLPYWLPY